MDIVWLVGLFVTVATVIPVLLQLRGHPKGLFVLFFAEMWERFSYYGMRGLLIFYLTEQFLFDDRFSSGQYGAYTALVYLLPLIGGFAADRFLGTRKAIAFGALLLVGGVLFVALHAVSDVGIYGLLVGKVALFGAHHDQGISYTLYLMTYALDSVADIFGSLFAFAAGVLVFRSGVLPRWLGWVSICAAPLLFLQAFGLGGLIASFGLVLDLIGFVLLLLFVLVSSVILLRRETAVRYTSG